MSLEPGTCLGPYEVIARLGAGGMGEVFRARDTDVSPDGTRILRQTEGLAGTPTITLIENAEAWLRRSDR